MEHESHERYVVVETRADDETHAADTSSRKGDNRKKKKNKGSQEEVVCLFGAKRKTFCDTGLSRRTSLLWAMISNGKTAS